MDWCFLSLCCCWSNNNNNNKYIYNAHNYCQKHHRGAVGGQQLSKLLEWVACWIEGSVSWSCDFCETLEEICLFEYSWARLILAGVVTPSSFSSPSNCFAGASQNCEGRLRNEVDHFGNGRRGGKVGWTGQRDRLSGKEHVEHGVFHLSVHEGRRSVEDDARSLHPSRILRGGGGKTLQNGQRILSAGWYEFWSMQSFYVFSIPFLATILL